MPGKNTSKVKVSPGPIKPVAIPVVNDVVPPSQNALFQKLFFGSLLAMLCIIWYTGYNVGVHSDEMDMNAYGKANIAYYMSGGKDTSFVAPSLHDGSTMVPMLKYYGSGFDYLAIGINKLLGNTDTGYEFNVRHMLNQLFAILTLLFAGFTVREVSNYKAALITIWLLFLTPFFFGLALFDTKDIPFCAGYMATIYYMARFFKSLPNVPWSTVTGLLLAMAFTFSIRIGGAIVLLYFAIFLGVYYIQSRKDSAGIDYKSILVKSAICVLGAFVICILFWPFALQNPVGHVLDSISVAKKFPQRIPITFDGDYITSLDIPSNYLVVYITRTVPVIILISICFSCIYLFLNKKNNVGIYTLLLLAAFFPLFYAVYSKLNLYNSWRHLLFFYPPVICMVGIGLEQFISSIKKKVLQGVAYGALALALIHPIAWSIKNSPYQYTYYNELSGGLANNYYSYETDFWQISIKGGLDWLFKNENIANTKDSVFIATNAFSYTNYYIKRLYPNAKIRVIQRGFKTRAAADWTYGVFSNTFLTPLYVENNFPPPTHVAYEVAVEGKAYCVVIKDTVRMDYKALAAFDKGNYRLADSLFTIYFKSENYDINSAVEYGTLLGSYAYAKTYMGNFAAAVALGNKAIQQNPADYTANLALGIVNLKTNNLKAAVAYFETAAQSNANDQVARSFLRQMGVK